MSMGVLMVVRVAATQSQQASILAMALRYI